MHQAVNYILFTALVKIITRIKNERLFHVLKEILKNIMSCYDLLITLGYIEKALKVLQLNQGPRTCPKLKFLSKI